MPLLILYQKNDGQIVSTQRINTNHSSGNFPPRIQRLLDNSEALGLQSLFVDDHVTPATHKVHIGKEGVSVVRRDEANPKWLEPLLAIVGEAETRGRPQKETGLEVRYVTSAAANPEFIKLQPGITVFVPLQARWHCAAELFDSLATLELPDCEVDLVLYDNSNDPSFGALCKWFLAGLPTGKYTSTQHIVDATKSTSDRHQTVHAVARIYRRMTHIIDREFVLTLEDDVIMKDPKTLKVLYEAMKASTFAAAGANVVERRDNKTMSWYLTGTRPNIQYAARNELVQTVDAVSFSCTLWRTRYLKVIAVKPQKEGSHSFFATDITLCAELLSRGWRSLMFWNLHCAHCEAYVAIESTSEDPFFQRVKRRGSTRQQVSIQISQMLNMPQPQPMSLVRSFLTSLRETKKSLSEVIVVDARKEIPEPFITNLELFQQQRPNSTVIIFGSVDPIVWQGLDVQLIDENLTLFAVLKEAQRVMWWDSQVCIAPEIVNEFLVSDEALSAEIQSSSLALQTKGTSVVWTCSYKHFFWESTTTLEVLASHICSQSRPKKVSYSQWQPTENKWEPNDWLPPIKIKALRTAFDYIGEMITLDEQKDELDLTVAMTCINHPEMTIAAVESILSTTEHLKREVLVWNNGSTVDMSALRAKYGTHPHVRLFDSAENRGYIYPMNFMSKTAKGAYYVVANNDIIAHPGWFEALEAPFKNDPFVAQTGPQPEYGRLTEGMLGTGGDGPIDYIEGYFFMVPRKILNRFPVFDSKHLNFATCEDADLSLRLKEAGFRVVAVPEARIDHLRSVTRLSDAGIGTLMDSTEDRNRRYMIERWHEYLSTRVFGDFRILVKRKGANGDLLACEPVLKGLRWKFPNARITLETDCMSIMKDCPWVDEVRPDKGIGVSYTKIIDLDHVYENDLQQNRTRLACELAEVPFTLPGYWIDRQIEQQVRSKLNFEEPYVVLHHYASWENRRWPIERWRELGQKLEVVGLRIFEVGGVEDTRLNIGESFYGKPWQEVAALLKNSSLCISSDSVILHLALGLNVPTICLFGPTTPRLVSESKKLFAIQSKGLACLGCHHKPPFPKTYSSCEQPSLYCQTQIRPCAVFRAAMDVLRLTGTCNDLHGTGLPTTGNDQ